jgi:hypothetical protein
MRNLSFVLALVGVCGLLAACSDDSTPTDAIILSDGPGLPDAGPDGPLPDQGPPPDQKVTDGRVSGLLGTVVNKLTLPAAATDFEKDIDGDGTKENRLGEIMFGLSALKNAGLDLQAELDYQLAGGTLLLLFEVFATSLADDAAIKLQFHQGHDPDGDPSNNFTGTAVLNIAAGSDPNIKLDGKITGGKMEAGPGNFVIPIPMGIQTLDLTLNYATVVGDVSSTGILSGQLNGAIPWSDVDQKMIPAIATMLDTLVQNPSTPSGTKDTILLFFDGNGDGSISDDEIRNSALLKIVLQPDLDMNQDGTKDHLSAGMGFTSVSCTIQ